MSRDVISLCLLALLSSACDHDLSKYVSERDAGESSMTDDAAVTKPMLTPEPDLDASVLDAGSALDAQTLPMDAAPTPSDAPGPFPYAWVANGPAPEIARGYVEVSLQCSAHGVSPADCSFACAFDGGPPRNCTKNYRVFAEPGPHEICVTVFAPPGDTTHYDSDRAQQCWTWRVAPYEFPWQWLMQAPEESSTELDLSIACHPKDAADPLSALRENCGFRCSLDHIPYAACQQRFQRQGLAPGAHSFRIEVCAPEGDEAEGLCETTSMAFTIAEDAKPPVDTSVTSAVLPPNLADEQLGELAALLEPYGFYALSCDPKSGKSIEQLRGSLRRYLSIALQQPGVTARPQDVETCKQALLASPPTCVTLPGQVPTFMDDGLLPVRLPELCRGLFYGQLANGERCVTHAECLNRVCERATSMDSQTYGYCADQGPAPEGIMCRVRGCEAGLFCYGSHCRRLGEVGALCEPQLQNRDCADGLTCSGSPRRCVRKSMATQPCRSLSDCVEGLVCDMEALTCRAP